MARVRAPQQDRPIPEMYQAGCVFCELEAEKAGIALTVEKGTPLDNICVRHREYSRQRTNLSDFRDLARGWAPAALAYTRQVLGDKGVKAEVRLQAAKMLMDRAHGQSTQPVEHDFRNLTDDELSSRSAAVAAEARELAERIATLVGGSQPAGVENAV